MILYFNHHYFNHPDVQKIIIEHSGQDILARLNNLANYNPACPPTYNRKGSNFLPFKYELTNTPGFDMPDYDHNHNKSWTEITDQRCLDLRARHFDRPWVVMWSGGIDSTNIVCALIRNLSQADLKNITIACTPVCVWENPEFYFKYIEPNFTVISSRDLMCQDVKDQSDIYTINGEPADQLVGGLGRLSELLIQNPGLLHKDLSEKNAIECAIDLISARTDKKFAEWYYHSSMTSAQQCGIPVHTLYQLEWWQNFNCAWTTAKFRLLYFSRWKNIKNAKFYIDQFVHWYDSNDYQQWAMNPSNTSEKLGTTASEYKFAAKKYIYSVDRDNYYLKYKTKMGSSDIFSYFVPDWCCIDHNWNLLDFQDHADQIVSMLPDHLAT
jgi:hypothetical protein